MADPRTRLDGNAYGEWLEMYAGSDYQSLARDAEGALDDQFARRGGEGRFPSLAANFAAGHSSRSRILADGARRGWLTNQAGSPIGSAENCPKYNENRACAIKRP